MVFSPEAGTLKIATFNINNINKRLHNHDLARNGAARRRLPPGTQGRAAGISGKRPS